jgi:hypothetical protein
MPGALPGVGGPGGAATPVIDNLASASSGSALSARQGLVIGKQLDGISKSVIYMAKHGVPGGTPDDTQAVMDLIGQYPAGTEFYPPNNVLSIQADALNTNTKGVIIGTDRSAHELSADSGPRIKILNDGVYGIKLGSAANYSGAGGGTGPNIGIGLKGVVLDFNLRKFSDAAVVMEGLSKTVFKHLLLCRVGADVAGRESIAMRMSCVWDSTFDDVFLHSCYNPGAPLVYFGPKLIDNNGNVNNIKFSKWHIEQVSGAVFQSAGNSNIDVLTFSDLKFESGQNIQRVSAENFVWDLDNAQRCEISGRNTLNRLLASQWGGVLRIGRTGRSSGNKMRQTGFYASSCLELVNGAFADQTEVYDNSHENAVAKMLMVNLSAEALHYVPATDRNNDDAAHGSLRGLGSKLDAGAKTDGWVSAQYLSCPYGGQYAPDESSLFPARSVLRQLASIAPYAYITRLASWRYADWPDSVTFYARCRRPSTNAVGALQITAVGGAGTTVQFSALAATTGWQVVTATVPQAALVGVQELIVQYGAGNAQFLDIDAIAIRPFAVAAAAPAQAPGAPTLAAGASTSTTQALTITAPTTGGAATSYAIFYKRASDPTYSAGPTGASLTPTVTGLTAGTSYNFKAVASNSGGASVDSNMVTVSTAAAPTFAPNAPAITPGAPTSSSITLNFAAPAVDGTHDAATSYASFYRLAGGAGYIAGPTGATGPLTLSGLAANTSYEAGVVAVNATGQSPNSNVLTTSTSAAAATSWVDAGWVDANWVN